jgi:glycosyltransferase involved in cell wall biosynthesis
MIKVLYVMNGVFHKGGTEAVMLNYYNNMDKNQIHIDFLVHGDRRLCRDNPTHRYLEENGSRVFFVIPRGEDYMRNKKEISDILQANKFDIIHTHMDAAGVFVLREARKANIKVRIAHSHNTGYTQKVSFLHKLVLEYARLMIRHYATHYLACSEAAGLWLFGTGNLKNGKVKVLRNAVDCEKLVFNKEIREKTRIELNLKDKFVIGNIGRFAYQKNHEFIIKVFNEIHIRNKQAVLLLVGEGELRKLTEAKVKELHLEASVRFLGLRDDISELLQAMDVFFLPSNFEGLPVVGVEAQAAGLPCIMSDNVSREVDLTGLVQFISLEESPGTWASRILEINESEKERENTFDKITTAGYDIKHNAQELERLYTEYVNLAN